jgi:hypothetical protein
MKNAIRPDEVQQLKEQLQRVRQQSLSAARQNDFRSIARLTAEAARLNRAIHAEQNFAGCAAKSLAIVDALAEVSDEGCFVFPQEPVLTAVSAPEFEEAA